MSIRPATRLLEGLAPWIPIAMLVALVGIAFYLRAQELGTGIGAVAWLGVAVASGLTGTRLPSHTLTALVVVLPIAPYLRYDTWLGQALPGVIAASVLVGVSLSPATAWGQMLRDQRRAIAMAVLTFAVLLAVSLVLVLLQRSSFLLGALGREEVGGFFSTGWAVLRPQNTFPVDRSGAFLLGPVAGLAFLSLLSRAGSGGHGHLGRDRLVGALLVTSALNVGVATGQVYIPGFPVDTLYEPTAGLFYNPVGLAELMTLAAPVALALSLQPGASRRGGRRQRFSGPCVDHRCAPDRARTSSARRAGGCCGRASGGGPWVRVSADHPMAASPRRHCRRSGFDRVAR